VPAKEPLVAGKGPLDLFARENVGERQAVLGQKRLGDLLKTAAATMRRIGYIFAHEKTLPGEFAARKPGRACFSSPGKGQNLKRNLTRRKFIRSSAPFIDQIARLSQPV
jgi:hypothetical protein